jgi:hypothetical protein
LEVDDDAVASTILFSVVVVDTLFVGGKHSVGCCMLSVIFPSAGVFRFLD